LIEFFLRNSERLRAKTEAADIAAKKTVSLEKIKKFLGSDTNAMRAFLSFLKYEVNPPIGSYVMTIRGGFGTKYGGVRLIIKGIFVQPNMPDYYELAHGNSCDRDGNYLSRVADWWSDFYVASKGRIAKDVVYCEECLRVERGCGYPLARKGEWAPVDKLCWYHREKK